MCETCWQYFGSPTELPEGWEEIAALISDLYVDYPTGGLLHCELDDWNLEDRFFEAPALERAAYDHRAPIELEKRIYAALRPLTGAQRAAVLAKVDGFF